MIFTLVPHIFRVNLYTQLRVQAATAHIAHAYMRSAAPLSRVSLVKWRRSSSHTLDS